MQVQGIFNDYWILSYMIWSFAYGFCTYYYNIFSAFFPALFGSDTWYEDYFTDSTETCYTDFTADYYD